MASIVSRLNPVPAFPEYTGPYSVGTVEVEVSVAELPSPSPPPDPAISTVQFRIFYPCEKPAREKNARWIPHPQHEYIGGYARFMGAGSIFAQTLAYFSTLLHHVRIPAAKNAPLLKSPTEAKRWPVMVFSHGLGGSRNAYSHICGSIASHGVIVVAPEHRDGSCPVTFIREVPGVAEGNVDPEKPQTGVRPRARSVHYLSLPHEPSPGVERARNDQLRVRLWELGMVHEALLGLDRGGQITNLAHTASKHSQPGPLQTFEGQMDVHTPGSVSWAGHSFGAATAVQFVKSVFYRPDPSNHSDPYFSDYSALYTPSPSSSIVRQITPTSAVILLDLWTLPLRGDSMRWLWAKPLPCYAPSGPGGKAVLAILSEAFYKWRANLENTKRALSEEPESTTPKQTMAGPRIFYPTASAHLSQSDFGVLFPWLTRRAFNAIDPERTLRLNTRAILQVLREGGVEVAPTSRVDMEAEKSGAVDISDKSNMGDWLIFSSEMGVKGWIAVTTDLGDLKEPISKDGGDQWKPPAEAVVDGEVTDARPGQGIKV
ncbi:MAG: hypothetical protein M1832_001718 [Thelocarpon impressellum]|nr:MAG: hypothetical protein M1832_001718 [Thelocarpon impressellum]